VVSYKTTRGFKQNHTWFGIKPRVVFNSSLFHLENSLFFLTDATPFSFYMSIKLKTTQYEPDKTTFLFLLQQKKGDGPYESLVVPAEFKFYDLYRAHAGGQNAGQGYFGER